MKFFAAIKSADFAAKLSAAAGFDFATAFAAQDVNALKAHIEAENAKAVAAAVKPDAALTEQVATLTAGLESAHAENETLTAALSGIGFTIPEDHATTKAALEAHIKIRAAGVLAQTGHPAIETAPGARTEASSLTGRALVEARIAASIAKLKAAQN